MIPWIVVVFLVLGFSALMKLHMLRRLYREVLAAYDRGMKAGAREGYAAAMADVRNGRSPSPRRTPPPPPGVAEVACVDCGVLVWWSASEPSEFAAARCNGCEFMRREAQGDEADHVHDGCGG